jgi:hypothetical protein
MVFLRAGSFGADVFVRQEEGRVSLHSHRSLTACGLSMLTLSAALAPGVAHAATTAEASAVVQEATATNPSVTAAAAQTATTAVKAATSTTATACPAQPVSQAFSKFGDTADYSLAPGGNFESGSAGWTLKGGAAIASGNESLGVTAGSKSLRLPPLAVAISPSFCVDPTHPTFRFAARIDTMLSGYVAVVLYRDSAGKLSQAQFNASATQSLLPSGKWFASDKAPLSVNIPLLASAPTASAQIMFMSTPSLGALSMFTLGMTGTVSVDSLMIDPYRRG